jgi:hypothetical protein
VAYPKDAPRPCTVIHHRFVAFLDEHLRETLSVSTQVRRAGEGGGIAKGAARVRDRHCQGRNGWTPGDGYQAAIINHRFLAHAVLSTDEVVDAMR